MARNPNSVPRRSGGAGASKALEINVRAGATLDYSSIDFDACTVSAQGDDLLLTLGDGRSLLYRGLARAAREDGPVDIRLPGDEVLPASAAVPWLLGEDAPAATAAEAPPAAAAPEREPTPVETPPAAPPAAAPRVSVAPAVSVAAPAASPAPLADDEGHDDDGGDDEDDDEALGDGDWFAVDSEAITGPPDAAIPLGLKPVATGSGQRLSVVIFGLPDGARLSAGSEMGGGAWRLRGDDVAGVTLTAQASDTGSHELTILATLVDEDGGTESASSAIVLRIDPEAAVPRAASPAPEPEAPPPTAEAPKVSVARSDGAPPVRVAATTSPPAASAPAPERAAPPQAPSPTAPVAAPPAAAAGGGEARIQVPFEISGWLRQVEIARPLAFGISGVPREARLTRGVEAGSGVWGVVDSELEGLQVDLPRGTEQFRLMVTATPAEFDDEENMMHYATASVQFDIAGGAVRITPVSGSAGAMVKQPQASNESISASAAAAGASANPVPPRPAVVRPAAQPQAKAAAAPANGAVVGSVAPAPGGGRPAQVSVRPAPAGSPPPRPAVRATPSVNVQAQTAPAATPARPAVQARVVQNAPSAPEPAAGRPVAVASRPPPQARPEQASPEPARPEAAAAPPRAAAPSRPAPRAAPAAAKPDPQVKQIDLGNAPDGEAAFDRDDVIEMTDADNLLYVTGGEGCTAVLHGSWRLLIENVQDADVGHRVNIYENQGARVATNVAIAVQVIPD